MAVFVGWVGGEVGSEGGVVEDGWGGGVVGWEGFGAAGAVPGPEGGEGG